MLYDAKRWEKQATVTLFQRLNNRWDRIAKERVARGVAWLDLYAPAGWWTSVRPNQLNLMNNTYCVLGQVFGHATKAKCPRWMHHGFVGLFLTPRLTREWIRVIEERRKGTPGSE